MAHGPLPGAGDSGPVVEEKYHTGRVVRMAVVAALGGFLFGFDSAVVNGTVDALKAIFLTDLGLSPWTLLILMQLIGKLIFLQLPDSITGQMEFITAMLMQQ